MGACFSCRLGVPPFIDLEITFQYAIPRSITFRGFKLDVTLQVHNPNKWKVDTTMFTYKITKKTNPTVIIAEGIMKDGCTLPGNETVKVVVPASCTFSAMGSVGESLMNRGKTDFVMKGETTYKIPFVKDATYTLPYIVEGEFVVTGPPPP